MLHGKTKILNATGRRMHIAHLTLLITCLYSSYGSNVFFVKKKTECTRTEQNTLCTAVTFISFQSRQFH